MRSIIEGETHKERRKFFKKSTLIVLMDFLIDAFLYLLIAVIATYGISHVAGM